MSIKFKIISALSLIFAALFSFFLFQEKEVALAGINHNLSGYAWSSNIGWISFNSTNCDKNDNGSMDAGDAPIPAGCPSLGTSIPNYGVKVNPGGVMSGYAWSDNVGWVSFADFDGDNDVDNNDKNIIGSPCAPNCEAKLDTTTGQVSGWAKALAGGSPGSGGWDGWIKLGGFGDSVQAGAIIFPATTCDWSGYAWGGDDDDPLIPNDPITGLEGDEVIGWIKFGGIDQNGDPYSVKGKGDACKSANAPTLKIVPPSATLDIGDNQQFLSYYDQDGIGPLSEIDVTSSATWSSGAILTINYSGTKGLAKAVSSGSTNVTVSYNGLSATANVTVRPAPSPTLKIVPPSATLDIGNTKQFIAWYDSDGTGPAPKSDATDIASWTSGNISKVEVSDISPTKGLAKAVSSGSTNVTVSYNGLSATANVTVRPAPSPSPSRPWWWWIWQEK